MPSMYNCKINEIKEWIADKMRIFYIRTCKDQVVLVVNGAMGRLES